MTLILSGTDGLSDIDGTAATPAIRGTDANTGIFFPAADTIAFSEGGTEAMRINSSGNVGIGTDSPTDTAGFGRCLDIRSSSGAAIYLRDSDDTTNDTFTIGRDNADSYLNSASGNMLFYNAGSEQARITSAGLFQFNSGYGSVATAYGCRAWVNFNGTGTVAIRASGNVSSITDGGVGVYTVNFSIAMPDVNFGWAGNTRQGNVLVTGRASAPGTSTLPIGTSTSSGATVIDTDAVHVSVFR